jgi:hypothetical protein
MAGIPRHLSLPSAWWDREEIYMTHTESTTHKKSKAPLPPADDLKLIRGIGQAIEKRLHEAGIHTFAQIATLSLDDLISLVPGYSSEQIARQDWIHQASLLSLQSKHPDARPKKSTNGGHQHYENYTIEFLLDQNGNTRRTRVVHIQSGRGDTWAGWEDARLLTFLGGHIPSKEEKQIPEGIVTSSGLNSTHRADHDLSNREPNFSVPIKPDPPISFDVREGRVARTSTLSNPDGMLRLTNLEIIPCDSTGNIHIFQHNFPCTIQIYMDLTALDALGTQYPAYTTMIFVKNLGGSRQFLVKASGCLGISKSEKIKIPNVRLPIGIFRLEACVTVILNGLSAEYHSRLSASLKGDLLQVY